MVKKAKRALNYLQTSYTNGLIDYPRVDNNLITLKSFDMFPHPSFSRISEKFKPLKYNKYKINKKNSILFLSITRVVTPSNIGSVFGAIDEMFDDDLNVKPEQKQYFESVLSVKNDFFKENGLTNNKVSELHRSVYDEVRSQDIYLCKIDELFVRSKKTPFLTSLQKQAKRQKEKKTQEKEENEQAIIRAEFETLHQAIESWQNMFNKDRGNAPIEDSEIENTNFLN